MVCKIYTESPMEKWYIHKEILQGLTHLLFQKDEMGGKFLFQKGPETYTGKTCKKVETKEGHGDSVQVPEGFVNFHTHPVPCYIGEKTTYGWFSGEDVRETIIFALKGTIAHLVLGVEGVYIMQVSICMLKSFIRIDDKVPSLLKKHPFLENVWQKHPHHSSSKKIEQIGDILRGLVILFIEIYFRATHQFRSFILDHKHRIGPDDYVKFVNAFQFSNLFSLGKKVEGCGDIKCGGIPVFDKDKSDTMELKKYIREFNESSDFYAVTKRGKTTYLRTTKPFLFRTLTILKDLDIDSSVKNCKEGRITKWFDMLYYPNKVTLPNTTKSVLYDNLTSVQRDAFLKYYYNSPNCHTKQTVRINEDPFFYFYKMNSDCVSEDVTNFLNHG